MKSGRRTFNVILYLLILVVGLDFLWIAAIHDDTTFKVIVAGGGLLMVSAGLVGLARTAKR